MTITATSVVGDLSNVGVNLAGATITAGQPVYKDSNNKMQLLDANALPTTLPASADIGVALNGGAVNQPIVWQKGGSLTIGGTVVAGTMYVVSANAGGIAPDADKASGWGIVELGRASTAAIIILKPNVTGITI